MNKSWVVGRAPDSDIQIDDPYLSPYHCEITLGNSGIVTIKDLGTMNGVWVRKPGQPESSGWRVVGSAVLHPPCIVRIGRTDLPWQRNAADALDGILPGWRNR